MQNLLEVSLESKPTLELQENNSHSYALVIRHGERSDNSHLKNELDKIEIACDPPLTDFGLKQARITGQYI
jgi:hypothetical protein